VNRIKCTFKGHCGNKMEREYCTNIPSISCSWQEPQPDWQNEGSTKTVSRLDGSQPDQCPVCRGKKLLRHSEDSLRAIETHLKMDRDSIKELWYDCPACCDTEQMPNLAQPDQDEIERDKISKSNAIGMGLIPPDQSSRLLKREQLEKILFSFENGTEATTYYIDQILSITEVDHKARIEALTKCGDDRIEALERLLAFHRVGKTPSEKLFAQLETSKKKWDALKANPTSEVEG